MPLNNTPRLQLTTLEDDDPNPELVFNQAIRDLESSVNSLLVVDTSGGNVTLSETDFLRNGIFKASGHSVETNFIIPPRVGFAPAISTSRLFVVHNAGTDLLNVSHGSGTVVEIVAGESALIYCDGVNMRVISSDGTGSGATISVTDEGVAVLSSFTSMDFVGSGATVTDDGDGTITISVPGFDGTFAGEVQFDIVGINTEDADTSNRLYVVSPNSVFEYETDDHMMSIDRATTADEANILFKTGGSGRMAIGEFGGNDNFQINTSSDGSTWLDRVSLNNSDTHIELYGNTTGTVKVLDGNLSVTRTDSVNSLVSLATNGALSTAVMESAGAAAMNIGAGGTVSRITYNGGNFSLIPASLADVRTGATTAANSVVDVTTGGFVGIGTASPTKKIHVAGTANVGVVLDKTDNGADVKRRIIQVDALGGMSLGKQSDAGSDTVQATLTTDGRLGIGTSTPAKALHTSSTANMGIVVEKSDNAADAKRRYLTTNGSGGMEFGKESDAGSDTSHVTIDTDGNLTVSMGTATVIKNSSGNIFSEFRNAGTGQSRIIASNSTDANSTADRGLMLFASAASAGIADFEARTISFVTTQTAGGTTATKMALTKTGLLGIGTTNPQKMLHTSGTAGMGIIVEKSDNATDLKRRYVTTDAAGGMSFGKQSDVNSDTLQMTLSTSGLLGVGTASPTKAFHSSGTTNMGLLIEKSNNSADLKRRFVTTNVNGAMVFGKQSDAGSDTSQMFLDTTGQLGIGVTAASYALDVRLNTADFTARLGSPSTVGDAAFTSSLSFSDAASPVNSAVKGYRETSTNGALALFTQTSSSLTEKVRVTSTGRVGIGTTAPVCALDVSAPGTETYGAYFRNSNVNSITGFLNSAAASTSNATVLDLRGNTSTTQRSITQIIAYYSDITDATRTSKLSTFNNVSGTFQEVTTLLGANLGIGTVAPTKRLHVSGTTNMGVVVEKSDNGADLKRRYVATDASGGMVFGKQSDAGSDTSHMTLNTSGQLGIGTTAPGSRLQIGDATVNAANRIELGKTAAGSGESYLPAIMAMTEGISNDLGLGATSSGGVVRFFTGVIGGPSGLFGTNLSTEKMRITANGNVGIGTTAPTKRLHTSGTTNMGIVVEKSDNGTDLKRRYVTTDASGGMGFGKQSDAGSDTLQMTLTTSGTLGINTAFPRGLIDVSHDSTAIGFSSGSVTSKTDGSVLPALSFFDASAEKARMRAVKVDATNGRLDLMTERAGVITTVATFDQNGNLGLGTSGPSFSLDIFGAATTTARLGTAVSVGNAAFASALHFSDTSTLLGSIRAYRDSSTDGALALFTRTANVQSEKLRVTSTGRLGLGTANPQKMIHTSATSNVGLVIEKSDNGSNLKRRYITTNASGGMEFGKQSDANADTTHATLDTNGNLGIGVTPTTTLHVNGPARVGSYTVAGLPSAATVGAGSIAYCTNETGGPVLVFSDGTDWRRSTDRAIAS